MEPTGFHIVRLYPAEGDSAIAELWHGEDIWGEVTLAGIDVGARGDERITEAAAVVRFYEPTDVRNWFEFALSDVSEQLVAAHQWLLDNERDREPLDPVEGLTRAGSAFSKIGDPEEFMRQTEGGRATRFRRWTRGFVRRHS